jgi:FtsZ-binding cell division protein ZapB
MGLLIAKMQGQGGAQIEQDLMARCNKAMIFARTFCQLHDLKPSLKALSQAEFRWKNTFLDVSSGLEIINRLEVDIVQEMEAKGFLQIEIDRLGFVDQKSLFGPEVEKSFNSAQKDITEAGNCLAAECNTAAVFHIMRAAEVSLRAIAVDRQVSFANKPIDQHEWGTILGALEGKLKDLRLDDGKNWASPEIKDIQIQFYNETVQELRGFNEAWRRYLSHADPQAFYEHDEAGNIFKHVRKFMQKLATKISETSTTSKYWTANEAK